MPVPLNLIGSGSGTSVPEFTAKKGGIVEAAKARQSQERQTAAQVGGGIAQAKIGQRTALAGQKNQRDINQANIEASATQQDKQIESTEKLQKRQLQGADSQQAAQIKSEMDLAIMNKKMQENIANDRNELDYARMAQDKASEDRMFGLAEREAGEQRDYNYDVLNAQEKMSARTLEGQLATLAAGFQQMSLLQGADAYKASRAKAFEDFNTKTTGTNTSHEKNKALRFDQSKENILSGVENNEPIEVTFSKNMADWGFEIGPDVMGDSEKMADVIVEFGQAGYLAMMDDLDAMGTVYAEQLAETKRETPKKSAIQSPFGGPLQSPGKQFGQRRKEMLGRSSQIETNIEKLTHWNRELAKLDTSGRKLPNGSTVGKSIALYDSVRKGYSTGSIMVYFDEINLSDDEKQEAAQLGAESEHVQNYLRMRMEAAGLKNADIEANIEKIRLGKPIKAVDANDAKNRVRNSGSPSRTNLLRTLGTGR